MGNAHGAGLLRYDRSSTHKFGEMERQAAPTELDITSINILVQKAPPEHYHFYM